MKFDCFKLVSECVDDKDTFTIDTQEGPKEVPVIKRGISTLDVSAVKGASEIAAGNTAKATKDPDPKQMKSDKEKGKPVGDAK